MENILIKAGKIKLIITRKNGIKVGITILTNDDTVKRPVVIKARRFCLSGFQLIGVQPDG